MLLVALLHAASSAPLIIGADISDLQLYIDAKAVFLDSAGKTVDPLGFLIEKGLEYARIRVFVNPAEGTSTGQSTNYVKKLAKKCTDAGLKVMINFHYSDSWADPGKQTKPSAWRSLSTADLIQKVYEYTKSSLQAIVDYGATVNSVQVGNEVTPGMLWPDGRVSATGGAYDTAERWNNFLSMLKNGAKAVREVCSGAKVIIHTDRGGDHTTAQKYYQRLADAKLDYDVIGLSFYPAAHGTMAQMVSNVNALSKSFGKQIWIVETAYAYAGFGGTWPATPEGQAQCLDDLIKNLKTTPGDAFFWWFPEETYSPNKRITEDLNSGWWHNKNGKALPAFDVLKKAK
jgi:arabinogalactan endo-1,4-beta-galactosidase